jgi:hypothetical protein
MITFAFLGNTLFLTILVSMLSNTFSTIVANATAEIQFRKAVQTLEGVKSDAIFAYQPPFNILAVFVLLPMKFLFSPRWFHKIHVASVRFLNLPVLLIIAIAERRILYSDPSVHDVRPKVSRFWDKWQITTHRDIHTVFETTPPDSMFEDIAADDELTHHMIRRQFIKQHSSASVNNRNNQQLPSDGTNDADKRQQGFKPPSRRDSMAPYSDELAEQVRAIVTEVENRKEGNVADRIDALEDSMRRIEDMLTSLCRDDEQSLGEDEAQASHMSGSLRDLDQTDLAE